MLLTSQLSPWCKWLFRTPLFLHLHPHHCPFTPTGDDTEHHSISQFFPHYRWTTDRNDKNSSCKNNLSQHSTHDGQSHRKSLPESASRGRHGERGRALAAEPHPGRVRGARGGLPLPRALPEGCARVRQGESRARADISRARAVTARAEASHP